MSSSVFNDVLEDPQEVQSSLLGPAYKYHENIKTPSQIGMSTKGSIKALGKNINGLIEYTELLVTGKSKASATGGPLGNKFFLKTGAKCVDVDTKETVDRHIYVNNIPNGQIPFISQGMGVNFSQFKGLIPGAMGNLNVLNPFGIMRAFLSGSTPDCQKITMEVVDTNNNRFTESNYVTMVDINNITPCDFPKKVNPSTGKKCREAFVVESYPTLDVPIKAWGTTLSFTIIDVIQWVSVFLTFIIIFIGVIKK
jgi:hypothetical protein